MMNNNIELKAINKTYQKSKNSTDNQVVVHDNFNLKINSGEFVALMGPSGMGKSTLLHLIGGLDKPTSGQVIIGGEQINNLNESQLTRWRADNIGFVFQSHHLLPVLTAQANVELPLALTHLNKSQRKHHAATALSLVSMADRAKHFPKELSGGQEQRVAIARAIVSDPKILLCDEPTGNLDRKTADEILSLLAKLNKEYGKTIVMVTHDLKAAEYASKVINLETYTYDLKAHNVQEARL
ncbi:ABC transporter ATP-binding protein [Pseudoalteromonas denitrificans]|jgi:putative ABC transport system ATP-binding protein|uniref:Putative ABC transport system ATP-binding protein n=1 Tax=Pseudoalteromonas denitrificans DSM 6059 TaxID=1123010 RepID=A0A1I1Q1G8_9GAMM|nr:ABC transporter ATP-binding protein [Pseudoalteromonas denitrificans]SFD15855.1 putative ABC transport system ATP-binding protein [Pseudoalteromonas denitrificans DSM 6059]